MTDNKDLNRDPSPLISIDSLSESFKTSSVSSVPGSASSVSSPSFSSIRSTGRDSSVALFDVALSSLTSAPTLERSEVAAYQEWKEKLEQWGLSIGVWDLITKDAVTMSREAVIFLTPYGFTPQQEEGAGEEGVREEREEEEEEEEGAGSEEGEEAEAEEEEEELGVVGVLFCICFPLISNLYTMALHHVSLCSTLPARDSVQH